MANIAHLTIDTRGHYVNLEDLIMEQDPTFAFVDGVTYTIQSQGNHHCILCEASERPDKGGFVLSQRPVKYVCNTNYNLYIKSFGAHTVINIAE